MAVDPQAKLNPRAGHLLGYVIVVVLCVWLVAGTIWGLRHLFGQCR